MPRHEATRPRPSKPGLGLVNQAKAEQTKPRHDETKPWLSKPGQGTRQPGQGLVNQAKARGNPAKA